MMSLVRWWEWSNGDRRSDPDQGTLGARLSSELLCPGERNQCQRLHTKYRAVTSTVLSDQGGDGKPIRFLATREAQRIENDRSERKRHSVKWGRPRIARSTQHHGRT